MRRLQFKFPNQIRISGWDFGSSARAMNQAGGKDSLMTYELVPSAQADLEKVSRSTTERKSMSTKTSIKRIALVAVSALGLGVLTSIVPANAAHSSATLLAGSTVASGSGTAAATQVVGGIATVVLTETATAGAVGDVIGTVSTSGVGTISSATAGSGITLSAASYPATTVTVRHSDTNAVNNIANTFTLSSAVAGVQTLTFTPIGSTGAPGTSISVTVTWGAAPTVSAQYSLVKLLAGAVTTNVDASTADTTATTVSRATGTQRFTIQVELNDQNNLAINGRTLTASIDGPGLIGIADGRNATTATGRSLSQLLTNDYGSISVWGDGSAGVATITIAASGVALGSKKVTFVGAPASAKVTQNLFIARAGTQLGATPSTTSTTNDSSTLALTPALYAEVMDSNGNDVAAGATVRMVSSDTTVITVGTCAEWSSAPGNFECSVSGAASATLGASATVTFQVQDPATGLYTIAAAPITFKIGTATISKETLTLDAASYEPGQALVLTRSAFDSAGRPVADGTASFVPSSNRSIIGLPSSAGYYVNGVKVTKTGIYAPSTEGSFTITGTSGNAAGSTVEVTASVNGASATAVDAANEATDAANAATDAANAAAEAADAATAAAQDAQAAVAALATQVASLIAGIKAQITTLTNLVIKIQKKVRA